MCESERRHSLVFVLKHTRASSTESVACIQEHARDKTKKKTAKNVPQTNDVDCLRDCSRSEIFKCYSHYSHRCRDWRVARHGGEGKCRAALCRDAARIFVFEKQKFCFQLAACSPSLSYFCLFRIAFSKNFPGALTKEEEEKIIQKTRIIITRLSEQ